ncbi:hypothetical protein [Chryseobacterium indologenes]|uniref:Tetratricopeptide repeat protein n=1 Tax=Chryseobacterium indologenes TaxID=253 RepID=A0A0N0IWK3_CHRID|nr:hypothetical protein [Chryseobacterium indologenes]KPE51463.1 hypothetical protein AOB46_09995 [Chryseobacterium indologenes]
MEKFQRYYLSFLLLIVYTNTIAQVSCNAVEGEDCKKACELYSWDSDIQVSRASLEGVDKAVELYPDFSHTYKEKSVPYLKNGDFVTWRILINQAVALDPKRNLGYRGWYRIEFLTDYNEAIQDPEELKKYDYDDLGRSKNSNYNLNIVRALSYRESDQKEKDKTFGNIGNLSPSKNYFKGLYGHYQLGVTYFELGRYDQALTNFEKQSKAYEFAENIYFKSKVSKIRNKDYLDLKVLALNTYDEGKIIKDAYTHHFNKVYRTQTEVL